MSREKHEKIRDIASYMAFSTMIVGIILLMFGVMFGFVISIGSSIFLMLQVKYELRWIEKHPYDESYDNQ